jgi:hypothetical protein
MILAYQNNDTIVFECPECVKQEKPTSIHNIALTNVEGYIGSDGVFYAALPRCPSCGAFSFLPASIKSVVSVAAHLRNCIVRAVIDAEQFREVPEEGSLSVDESEVAGIRTALRTCYTSHGDADLTAQFDGTQEITATVRPLD